MKGNGYQITFVVILFSFNILAVVSQADESNDEAQPNYEYIQIFKSIPALFEYLLDALEERPEILEKNDVTMFKRNIDGAETDECENSDSEHNFEKRDADCDKSKAQDKHGSDKVDKRDIGDAKDVLETTVAYEYGNSNVVMKGIDVMDSDKVISKRFANTENFNNFADKEGIKRELLKREDRVNRRKKRNVLFKLDDDTNYMFQNYGEMFFGFEHLFGLDLKPEDIEERSLTAEKLLEEHNNKKDKK